jgi:negative regulator of replication initiation
MKSISLEEDVYAELEKLRSPIFSHNDVIRKLLTACSSPSSVSVVKTSGENALVAFVKSGDFQQFNTGIKRYLSILGWLYSHYATDFKKVEDYRRGNRVYFARSQKAVEEGGNGDIRAKLIPNSPLWTLATLDNRSKRVVLSDLLRLFNFKPAEINEIVATIPDSDRGVEDALTAELRKA